MPASERTRALLSLSALLALAGCPAPAAQPDAANSPDVTEAGPAPDVTAPLDAAAPDAVATADASDASHAEAGTCDDLSGAYEWTITNCVPDGTLVPLDCLTQTGCRLTDYEQGGGYNFTVVGNVATVLVGGMLCRITVTGDTATEHCQDSSGGGVCEGTGVRTRVAGTAGYCCDVSQSACGTGQRCQVLGATRPQSTFTACVPTGTLAEGAACTLAGGRTGADECGAGLTCSALGAASATALTCQRLCTTEATCHTGELCNVVSVERHAGVCAPRCTLGGSECGAGLACRPTRSSSSLDGDYNPPRYELACEPAGAGVAGASCAASPECGPGLACASDTEAALPVNQCRPLCDATTRPCAAGQHCLVTQPPLRVAEVPYVNMDGLGTCFAD